MRKSNYTYTIEELQAAVLESASYAQVLRRLGLNIYGSAYRSLKRNLTANNISTAHFTGQGWLKGKTHGFSPKIPLYEIIYENKHPFYNITKLRTRLIEEGLLRRECESCKLTEWLGKQIPIELDHIDGNNQNNHITNLRILCRNCHGMTETFGSKNKKSTTTREDRKAETQDHLTKSAAQFAQFKVEFEKYVRTFEWKNTVQSSPIIASHFGIGVKAVLKYIKLWLPDYLPVKSLPKVKIRKPRPTKFDVTKEQLETLVGIKSFLELGRIFGVSDNAVRKRCKKFGIAIPPSKRGRR